MISFRILTLSAATALLLTGLPSVAVAAEMPGDACAAEGQIRPLGSGSIQCVSGVWQPSTLSPASPTAPTSSSNAKTAKIFAPVGVALSQATFGSTGKQVADATAFLLPSGQMRLFAFVNDTTGLPGLRSATSTSKTGLTFTNDGTNPFPGTPVGQPRAVALGGNSLRLFFVEGGNVNSAVSSDGGATFAREGTVLTTEQAGFEPGVITVIKHKGVYRAYFSNLEKPGERAQRVMKTATSPDMLHWTVGPTVVAQGGSHPFAVTDKTGKVALYYAADRGSTYGIFVSTSKDGINFSKEKFVMAGSADQDIIKLSNGKALMYYGADLGAEGFGVKVARAVGNIIP
ncbi:MAG: hypothetical protein NTU77_08660 [Actinobacteria bacterium]|nr:hypothetical protein [Actinomycetota bacterium]